MEVLRILGENERLALEFNASFVIAIACRRCRHIRREPLMGFAPDPEPKLLVIKCMQHDPSQPSGRCGGDLWCYDDNDLGRHRATALDLPTG